MRGPKEKEDKTLEDFDHTNSRKCRLIYNEKQVNGCLGQRLLGHKVNAGVTERFIIVIDGFVGFSECQTVKWHN